MTDDGDIPRIDLSDPEVARDPFTAYGRARERAPLARLIAPGLGPMWAVTRYTGARAMLADERFRLSPASFLQPQAPEDCRPYMRTMQEMEGPEHARLRRLVAAAFTPRRAESLRPRIERIAGALLDAVADQADGDHADLLTGFARPLPIEVICELIGIPGADRRPGASTAPPSRPAMAGGSPPPCRPSSPTPGRPSRAAGPTRATT